MTNLDPIGPQETVVQAYQKAGDFLSNGNILGWRNLVDGIRPKVHQELLNWINNYEQGELSDDEVDEAVLIAATLMMPYLVLIKAEKTTTKTEPIQCIDELLYIPDWNNYGNSHIAHLPYTLLYVYQALYGAMAMHTDQITLNYNLADFVLPDKQEGRPLFLRRDVIGWPDSLGHNCKRAWDYLYEFGNRFDSIICKLFGDTHTYQENIVAHYIFLSLKEFSEVVLWCKENDKAVSDFSTYFVPPLFLAAADVAFQKAISKIKHHASIIQQELGLTDSDINTYWNEWAEKLQTLMRKMNYLIMDDQISLYRSIFD